MQNVKCLKCKWKGSSVDTLKQWFPDKMTDEHIKTEELLMICPECKNLNLDMNVLRRIGYLAERIEKQDKFLWELKDKIVDFNIRPWAIKGIRELIDELSDKYFGIKKEVKNEN